MTTTIRDIRRMARENVQAELGDEFYELDPDELDHILRSEEEYLVGICEDFGSERAEPRNIFPLPRRGRGSPPEHRKCDGGAAVRTGSSMPHGIPTRSEIPVHGEALPPVRRPPPPFAARLPVGGPRRATETFI